MRRATVAHQRDQVVARASDARSDRPHRAAAHRRRLLVGELEELGQDEGDAPVGLQVEEQLACRNSAGRVVGRREGVGDRREARVEPVAAVAAAQLVHAHATRDREDPRAPARVPAEPWQRPRCPQEGLLRQIVRGRAAGERCAEAPDRRIARLNELLPAAPTIEPSVNRDTGRLIHRRSIQRGWLTADRATWTLERLTDDGADNDLWPYDVAAVERMIDKVAQS